MAQNSSFPFHGTVRRTYLLHLDLHEQTGDERGRVEAWLSRYVHGSKIFGQRVTVTRAKGIIQKNPDTGQSRVLYEEDGAA